MSPPAPTLSRPPIAAVVQQHAEESAHLRHVRSVLVRAPHVKLLHLGRLDERIEAHLDGLAVAGEYGQRCARAALERPGAGEVFAVAVGALESHDEAGLERLLALAELLPDVRRGLLSAFGWVAAAELRGTVRALLGAAHPGWRAIGIAACRLHRVDPGAALTAALRDPHTGLRSEALRTAATLGRCDLIDHALGALAGPQTEQAVDAAWAACLLGNRGSGLAALQDWLARIDTATTPLDARLDELLATTLQAAAPAQAQARVRSLAAADAPPRLLIRAIGLLGDARWVPWLIERMADLRLARLAGESFTLITGADLAALDLERKPPEGVDFGPSEDPADDDVTLDADESLPWPDPTRVLGWWRAHAASFGGERWFMGAPPSIEHCNHVLRGAAQRQRAVAARYLALMAPGKVLFPIAAPTRRQQRLLATSSW